jgi:hypothetical protein
MELLERDFQMFFPPDRLLLKNYWPMSSKRRALVKHAGALLVQIAVICALLLYQGI